MTESTTKDHPIYRMSKEEVLVALLRKEHHYYTGVLELAEQEHHLLTREAPVAAVTQVMKQRRILLQCINEIDTALTPLKKHWNEGAKNTSAKAPEVKEQLSALDKLLQRILHIDQENQTIFQKRLLALREVAVKE